MYPLLLSQFLTTPPDPVRAGESIILVQQLCGILAAVLLFLTLRRAFSGRVALWGAVAFLLWPLQLYYEVTILTEAQFVLLLSLFLWLAGRVIEAVSLNRLSSLLCVTVGLSAAVLSLSRPIGQLLMIALWGFCLLRYGLKRRTIFGAALAVGVFVVSVFPWMKLNYDRYGFWGISRDFGINMYHRVVDVGDTPLPLESSDTFIREVYLKAKSLGGPTYFHVFHALKRSLSRSDTPKRLVNVTIDKRMGDFALEVLKAHPYDFIPQSIHHVWRLFVSPRPSLHFCEGADGLPFLCSNHPGEVSLRIASDPTSIGRTSKRRVLYLMRAFRVPDLIVSLLGVIGLVVSLRRSNREQPLFLAFTIAYFVGLAAIFNTPEDRFRLPVDGILLAFAVVGAISIVEIMRRRRA
jgi:4-amino-4-deoxy-L-arabinose transferase-like glycosyltransferase